MIRRAPATPQAKAPWQAPDESFSGLHITGFVLLGLSLALPLLVLWRNWTDARGAAEMMGGIFMNALLWYGIAWAVTRKRTRVGRGIAAFLAGLCVFGMAGAIVGERSDGYLDIGTAKLALKDAMDDARIADGGATSLPERPPRPEVPQARRQRKVAMIYMMAEELHRAARETAEMNRRYLSIDLSHALDPANLVAPAAVARGRAQAVQLRAMVTERGDRQKAAQQRLRNVLAGADIPAGERDSEVAAFDRGVAANLPAIQEVLRANLATVNAFDSVLELVQRSPGTMSARGNRLVFNNQRVLDEYNRRIAGLREASTREDEAIKRIGAEQERRRRAAQEKLFGKG